MKRLVSALVICSLVILIGCESNDENTVNAIPKTHDVNPVFHIAINNGYYNFGIDSILMTFEPYMPGYGLSVSYYDTTHTKVFHKEMDPFGALRSIVDSVRLTEVSIISESFEIPDYGTGAPGSILAYSDSNGFIGGMAAGTYIVDIHPFIDTIAVLIDTTDASIIFVDTIFAADSTVVSFSFNPSTDYTFTFQRDSDFVWIDSFKVNFIETVDSLWLKLSAETLVVAVVYDPTISLDTILDSIAVILVDPPVDNLPDSDFYLPEWRGIWEDTVFGLLVVDHDSLYDYQNIDSEMTSFWEVFYDSIYLDSTRWGYWNRIDSFFLPSDSSYWCTDDSVEIVITVIELPPYGDTVFVLDSVYHYFDCDEAHLDADSIRNRIYNDYGWGTYPGGDDSRPPIASFDTIQHFTFVDTTKSLIFGATGLSILNHTDSITRAATMYLKTTYNSEPPTVTTLDSLVIPITLPPVEDFPDYEIIIIDEAP